MTIETERRNVIVPAAHAGPRMEAVMTILDELIGAEIDLIADLFLAAVDPESDGDAAIALFQERMGALGALRTAKAV